MVKMDFIIEMRRCTLVSFMQYAVVGNSGIESNKLIST